MNDKQIIIQLKSALKNLVHLKKHKDLVGKDDYYLNFQPKAWRKAIGILNELTEVDTNKANLNIPVVSNSFCECKTPKYNYPEMLWCDTCGKEINEDKQKEELLIAYTKWQYQDDSFDEADKLMVKTFLKDYKGNL